MLESSTRLLPSLRRIAPRKFRPDARGTVLVEFALVTPVALAFIGLIVAMGQGMEAIGKASLTAKTIGNLVSMQTGSITKTNLTCILGAAQLVMTPLSTTGLTVTVSEILVGSNGVSGTVQWSQDSTGGSGRAANSTVTISNGQLPAGSYQLMTEVTYVYTPTAIIDSPYLTYTFGRTLFIEPRNGSSIAYVNS